MNRLLPFTLLVSVFLTAGDLPAQELHSIDNGTIKIGIDREKGGSITWLSSSDYPTNMVNIADPGRLIQQSYYAGDILDRRSEGQSKSWSPWSWNPIQGGGVGSWANASKIQKDGQSLYSETTPKLWDMPNEEAEALMKQWTAFESSVPNAIVVRCEFQSLRDQSDRWGGAKHRHQEVPACYFTRSFSTVKSYLGNKQWQIETQPPGPPWGKANPPRKSMAMFDKDGQGVAIFSPTSNLHWNFGPHAGGQSKDPTAGPCMHVAPISNILLGPQTTLSYRYWLVVGDIDSIANSLDKLWEKYSQEQAQITN